MSNFDAWVILVFGIWFTISGSVDLYKDIRKGKATKWWRWILDSLAVIIGIWFIVQVCWGYFNPHPL